MNSRALGLAAIIALAGCSAQKTQEQHLEARIDYYEEGRNCKKEAMKPENAGRKDDLLGEAFKYFESAKIDPEKTALATIQQADIFAAWGDMAEAIKYTEEAIRIKPCVETYNGQGQIFLRCQLYSIAINSFTEAIKISDNEASRWGRFDAYLLAGTSQGNKDYLKKAIKDAKKCAEFSPEDPDGDFAQAAARLSLKDPEEVPKAYSLMKEAMEKLNSGKNFKRYDEKSAREIWDKFNDDNRAQ